jgi:hypothetical protein
MRFSWIVLEGRRRVYAAAKRHPAPAAQFPLFHSAGGLHALRRAIVGAQEVFQCCEDKKAR